MKTLLEHLNHVSKERWFKNFRHATDDGRVYMVESIIKEAGNRYALEVAREALKNAAENAIIVCGNSLKTEQGYSPTCGKWCGGCDNQVICEQSILDEENIPEL